MMFRETSARALILLVILGLGAANFIARRVYRNDQTTPESTSTRLKDLTYQEPRLQAVFARMLAAGDQLAEPSWTIQRPSGKAIPGKRGYHIQWCSQQIDDRVSQRVQHPYHAISILAEPRGEPRDPNRIVDVILNAATNPGNGWGVHLWHRISSLPSESVSIQLKLILYAEPGGSVFWLQLPSAVCSGTHSYEGWEYRYHAQTPNRSDMSVVRSLLSSPESFQRFALDEYDRLEQQVQNHYADGTLVDKLPIPIGYDSKYGALPEPPEELRVLNDLEQQRVLEAALSHVRRARALIKQDYRQLHAAAVSAFPLLECLADDVDDPKEGK